MKTTIVKDLSLNLNAIHDCLYDISDYNSYHAIHLSSIQFDAVPQSLNTIHKTKIYFGDTVDEDKLLVDWPITSNGNTEAVISLSKYQDELREACVKHGITFTLWESGHWKSANEFSLTIDASDWPLHSALMSWLVQIIGIGTNVEDDGSSGIVRLFFLKHHLWPEIELHPNERFNDSVVCRLGFRVKKSADHVGEEQGFVARTTTRELLHQVPLTCAFELTNEVLKTGMIELNVPIFEPWKEPIVLDQVRIRLESRKTGRVYWQPAENFPLHWALVFASELHETFDEVFISKDETVK
jgi:hypothetical protein